MSTLAIDFGTSNTVVAVENGAQPLVLALPEVTHAYEGSPPLIPSALWIGPNQQVRIGQQALQQRADPQRLFRGFKRELVQPYETAPSYVDGQPYRAGDKIRLFLQEVLRLAVETYNLTPGQVVFTVPVGAYESYLHHLEEVASALDLGTVRFVDEPTAAALGYGLDRPGTLVLVVDMGGGTLDLSLVRTQPLPRGELGHRAEVMAKTDRAYGCGGVDIDRWIAEWALQRQGLSPVCIPPSSFQVLVEIAERLKIRLSRTSAVQEAWLDETTFQTHLLAMDRPQLEELLEQKGLLLRLREAIDEVLAAAYQRGVTKDQVEAVLLVGGTSLIPAVQQEIKRLFGPERVWCDRPFEAVAYGAVRLGQWAGVQDHLRHTYALRLWNPFLRRPEFYPLFPSGTAYPATTTLPPLQANADGQGVMTLVVGELVSDGATEVYYDSEGWMQVRAVPPEKSFRPLHPQEQIQLPLSPPGQVGVDRLLVSFSLDTGRRLRVTVRDMLTGQWLLVDQMVARLR